MVGDECGWRLEMRVVRGDEFRQRLEVGDEGEGGEKVVRGCR